MRRFVPPVPRGSFYVRLLSGLVIAMAVALTTVHAQKPYPGRNVNVMSGVSLPDGDPYLQRQNEPSIAGSTRNPMHLLGGSNDYRTVDIPGLNCAKVDPDTGECLDAETRDAWLGLFKSFDGGQRWKSGLHPGYAQDGSEAGKTSPLKAYQAGADAVVRAGTHGLVYYSGLVFDRDNDGKSAVFLSRFIDNNNLEAGDPFAFLGTTLVAKAPAGSVFLDKPWLAVDIPRGSPVMCSVSTADIVPTTQPGKAKARKPVKAGKKGTPTNPQQVPGGAVYVSYTAFSGEGPTRSAQIWITRSMDCGKTWIDPIRVSRTEDQLNQGSNIAIDPRNGNVYVAYRRFDPNYGDSNDLDAMMVARIPFNSKKADTAVQVKKYPKPKTSGKLDPLRLTEHRGEEAEEHANAKSTDKTKAANSREVAGELEQFDLDDRDSYSFRSLAYPTMTIDGEGRVYVAWTQRGFASDPVLINGVQNTSMGARVVMTTSPDGKTFTPLQVVDDHSNPGKGHQLMPSMTFAGGKLMLIFYDMRETKARNASGAGVHTSKASDIDKTVRHTIDIRSVVGKPGAVPTFSESKRVSDYLFGVNPATHQMEQLQVNPPNLPMFKKGTAPFMGDYIDLAATPAFIPQANGKWIYNVNDTGVSPVFHAVWTDNRDVRPPSTMKAIVGSDGRVRYTPDWTKYTPAKVTANEPQRQSLLDGSTVPQCSDDESNAGSRNQNVYTSRITTDGLIAGSPGNAKPLSTTLQRGFVVFATNTTDKTKSYRMTILSQPVGGRASFDQFPLPPYTSASPAPRIAIEMIVNARSTAARTVYVTSSDPDARVNVDVSELVDLTELPVASYPTAAELPGGAGTMVFINPDVENPDVENPDVENPDVENPDVENAEVFNPDVENPDVENPDVENPDVENPDVENPDVENPDVENPDVENPDVENPDVENVRVQNIGLENPDVENPDVENPDVENPDVENPDVENPDVENHAIADITWQVTNTGNTTASFNVNLFLAQQTLPLGVHTQLILLKTYRTPATAANKCELGFQVRNVILANIPNPNFVESNGTVSDPNDPLPTNATMWLAPGEEGRIVLRTVDDTPLEGSVLIPKLDEYGDPILDENNQPKLVRVPTGFAPSENITPVVQQQAVNSEEAQTGVTEPPIVPAFPSPQAAPDSAFTTYQTPVTLNVLANDSVAFGQTKIVSTHPAGLGQNMGGAATELVYMPSTNLLYAGSGRTIGVIDPLTNKLVGRIPYDPTDGSVTYGVASPQAGLVFFRTMSPGAPGASILSLDVRPTVNGQQNPNFHKFKGAGANQPQLDALGDAFTVAIDRNGMVGYYAAGFLDQSNSGGTQITISAVDINPAGNFGNILWTRSLPQSAIVRSMVQNPATGKLYVAAVGSGTGTPQGGVYVIDPTANVVGNFTKLAGIDPSSALAVNPLSNTIVAAGHTGSPSTYRFNIIDGATDALLGQRPVPAGPNRGTRGNNTEDRLVIHNATGKAYLRTAQDVFVLDTKAGSANFGQIVETYGVSPEFNSVDLVINQQRGLVATTGNFRLSTYFIDVVSPGITEMSQQRAGGELAADAVHNRIFAADFLNSIYTYLTPPAAPIALGGVLTVAPESANAIVNPLLHRAYAGVNNDNALLARIDGSGLMTPPVLNVNSKGRWGFMGWYSNGVTSRIAATNNGTDAAGQVSRPGSLTVIDPATEQIVANVDTIGQPFGLAVNQATGQVVVAGLSGVDADGVARSGKIAIHDILNPTAGFATATIDSTFTALPNSTYSFGRHVAINPTTGNTYVMVIGGSQTSVVYLPPTVGLAAATAYPINVSASLPSTALAPRFPGDTVLSSPASDYRVEVIRVAPAPINRIYLGMSNQVAISRGVLDAYRVVVLDGNSHGVLGVFAGGSHSRVHTASWLALDAPNNRLYVVDYEQDKVSLLNATTLTVVGETALPDGPSATALNATNGHLYVSSVNAKAITALNAATLEVLSSVKLPLQAFFIYPDEVEGRIYTTGGTSFDESGLMVVTDVLGKLGTDVTVTEATNGSYGTVAVNDDYSVTYTPNPTIVCPPSGCEDTFTYTVHNQGGDATGTVTINVAGTVAAPLAIDDVYQATLNQDLIVGAPGVLGNDVGIGGIVTTARSGGSGGTLTLANDGSFTYHPANNFTGQETFTYTVTVNGTISNVGQITFQTSAGATFTVINTLDSGAGSLRNAIQQANTSSASSRLIRFSIPGTGPFTIQTSTPLPDITVPVTIDGYTQPLAAVNTAPIGTNATILIQLRGGGTSVAVGPGLNVTGQGGVTIRGLSIGNFNSGVTLGGTAYSIVEGSFLGVDADGTTARGNAFGVRSVSPGNMIGTATLAGRNLISGNNNGVMATVLDNGSGTVLNDGGGSIIINNLIGTTRSGLAKLQNNAAGVGVHVTNVRVGGASALERNVIAGNSSSGVFSSVVTFNNTALRIPDYMMVQGNYIGLGADGQTKLTNSNGVTVVGANSTVDGNFIFTGNVPSAGIILQRLLNGAGTEISSSSGTTVRNNTIGLSATNTFLNSLGTAIQVNTASNHILSNVISGNGNGTTSTYGILISGSLATGNDVRGNYIGTNASGAGIGNNGTGIAINDASGNFIGGSQPGDGNYIVGNSFGAIQIFASSGSANGNTVRGNFLGVLPNGTTYMNLMDGVTITANFGSTSGNIIGGPGANDGNVIGGNNRNGIGLYGANTTGTLIQGNYIGVSKTGADIHNNAAGVWISDASGNTVGGTIAAEGNVIAYNPQVGVGVQNVSAQQNRILSNTIYGSSGLGIDLTFGANNSIAQAALSNANNGSATTHIDVNLGSHPAGNYTVQFYSNVTCDAAGGEGEHLIGTATIAQPGVSDFALFEAVPTGRWVTATVTDASGNTSRFSQCTQVAAAASPNVVTNVNDSGAGSLRNAITFANANPGTTITFNVPGVSSAAPATINLTSALPAITAPMTIDGTSQPGYVVPYTAIELNGSGAANASGLTIPASGVTVKALTINRFPRHGIEATGNNFVLTGSFIGVRPDGVTAAGNSLDGVSITGSSNIIGGLSGEMRNIIAGNGRDGVRVASPNGSGNVLLGNFIGINIQGNFQLPNARNGVTLEQSNTVTVGGSANGSRNIISGNGQHGIDILVCSVTCNGHVIEGNRIGTDAGGTAAVANLQHGIRIEAAANNTIRNNQISGNTLDGINVHSTSIATGGNQTIVGNLVGTTLTGNGPLGNLRDGIVLSGPSAGIIGGSSPLQRNVVSWNQRVGVYLNGASDVQVQGNYIGISFSGSVIAGNGDSGVLIDSNSSNNTIGGATQNLGNVVAKNGKSGVVIWGNTNGNFVRNNIIGWDPSVQIGLGNAGHGVAIDGNNNVIDQNVIGNNTKTGIHIAQGTGNRLTANRISNNAELGIDLGNPGGQTANDNGDGDSGPNNFQNYPVLSSVLSNGSDTTVIGTLNSTPNSSFTMEFFVNTTNDPTGYGEGAQYLAQLPANTDGAGNFNFSATMQNIVTAPGQWVSVTATNNATGDTSEFSLSAQVVDGSASTVVITTNDSGAGSLRQAMINANNTPGTQTITFNIPGPAVIYLASPLPVITSPVVIDGQTSNPGWDGKPVVEINGQSAVANGFETATDVGGVTISGLIITRFTNAGVYFAQTDSGPTPGNGVFTSFIGVDRSGGGGKGNATGVIARSDNAVISTNVISGNNGAGILIENDADGVNINGNIIGLADNNISPRPNAQGIVMYGSVNNALIEQNTISGNIGWGIDIQSSAFQVTGTTIAGNIIGLDVNGNDAGNGVNNPPGGGGGIRINNAPGTNIGYPTSGRNIISGNGGPNPWEIGVGILVEGPLVNPLPAIRHNYIGLDQSGVVRRSNENKGIDLETPAIVGGTGVNDRNYIAGNGDISGGAGIILGLNAGGSIIQGNTIGLNVNNDPVGNGFAGITVRSTSAVTIGGTTAGSGNVISSNAVGIHVTKTAPTDPLPSGHIIQGNFIGTDPTGTVARGNAGSGIFAGGNNLQIGAWNGGNTIKFNGGEGVGIPAGVVGVRVETNVIDSNGGIGVDHHGNGVTANDPGDTDGVQNFLTISSASNNGSANTYATVNTNEITAGQYLVEFFKSPTCDPSGFGEGAQSLIRFGITAQTGIAQLDLNQQVPLGWFVTNLVTSNGSGTTSEFSNCRQVTAAPSISSVDPGPFASGQMITINGSNFNPQNTMDILFLQGSNGYPVQSIFYSSPTKLVVRTPAGLPNAQTTIMVSQNGSSSSTPFNVTLQTREGTPNFITMRNGTCSGYGGPGDTSQSWSGGDLLIAATGIDVNGGEVVFTPQGGGSSVMVTPYHSCQFATGEVAIQVQVPALAAGNYNVTVRSNSLGQESLDSASKPLTIITQFINATSGNGGFGQFVGTMKANQNFTITASGLAQYNGTSQSGPDGGGPAGIGFLAPALPAHSLIARINGGAWFLVGSSFSGANNDGEGWLEFAMNDDNYSDNAGGWSVTVSPQ